MGGYHLQPAARAYVTHNPPPDADMTVPPDAAVITKLPKACGARYTHARDVPLTRIEPTVAAATPAKVEAKAIAAYCKCGVILGRSGKCPALCEPLPKPAPAYTGPMIVGKTHISKLAAPVTGWIGGRS